MRICLVYDCLFPHTVGGAERWYRQLGERLAREGHEVAYLTLRQWPREEPPEVPGVRVRAVGPRLGLYTRSGRRRILPPLLFGFGVLAHLLLRGGRYDVVHTASFPFFSLLAAALVRRLHRFRLVVDWHEVWSRSYWRDYLGRVGGWFGWWVQRRCARVRQRAFCFSRLHAERLQAEGIRGPVTVLEGEYVGRLDPAPPQPPEPVVVFAGRHIPEKRVPALVSALAVARRRLPELRGVILGDGPERDEVLGRIGELGLEHAVSAPGFVSSEFVEDALASAMCMALPSRREGYGLVVIEAASFGTPSVVVKDPDNAAVELVDDGVNGVIAASGDPEDLAEAVLRVHAAGSDMREFTSRWFAANARRLSLESSLEKVVDAYSASARS